MIKVAILARIEAKSGKEKELEAFLKSALAIANEESATIHWFALKLSDSTFGIFDTFESDHGRKAHVNGKIPAALMAKASELLAQPPVIEEVELIAVKQP